MRATWPCAVPIPPACDSQASREFVRSSDKRPTLNPPPQGYGVTSAQRPTPNFQISATKTSGQMLVCRSRRQWRPRLSFRSARSRCRKRLIFQGTAGLRKWPDACRSLRFPAGCQGGFRQLRRHQRNRRLRSSRMRKSQAPGR